MNSPPQRLSVSSLGSLLLALSPLNAQGPDLQPSQPFALVANQGQWNADAQFRAQRGAGTAWFLDKGFVFHLRGRTARQEVPRDYRGSGQPQDLGPESERHAAHVIAVDFVGQTGPARVLGSRRLPGVFNFYRGAPDSWRTGVPTYGGLRYAGLYRGIELRVREGQGLFAYDLHCAPGADLAGFGLRVRGTEGMHQDEAGNIHLSTPLGILRHSAPRAWQDTRSGRRDLQCRAILDGDIIRFELEGYDASLPLVIDPDWTWATLFGGGNWEVIRGMAVTSGKGAGAAVLMAGSSYSPTLPITTGRVNQGTGDAIAAWLDTAQTGAAQQVWATVIGGPQVERIYGADVDVLGNCYICGITRSSTFPTTGNALQGTFGGGASDGFYCELSRTAGTLTRSSFLGGTGNERICEIRVAGALQVHLAGFATASPTGSQGALVPSTGAYQPTVAGLQDAFVGRLNAAQSSLDFLTFYGTNNTNEGWPFDTANPFYADMNSMGLDIDGQGRVMICGMTWSGGLPLKNAAIGALQGGGDTFVAIFDPQSSGTNQLEYSTYVGGNYNDGSEAVRFDPTRPNHILVGGWTYSPNLPVTTGAYQSTFVGPTTTSQSYNDSWLCWLDISKTGRAQIVYCTYFAGQSWEGAAGIFIDRRGAANFGGWGNGTTDVTPGAWQTSMPTGVNYAGYFARIHPSASGSGDLVYGTLVGSGSGVGDSYVAEVMSDEAGGAFIAGNTAAAGFPTPGGLYTVPQGGRDGFIGHLWGINHGIQVIGAASPAGCAGALNHGAEGDTQRGNADFALTAWGAQPNAPGFLGLGPSIPVVPVCGASLGINPVLVVPATADAQGEVRIPAPVPAGLPASAMVSTQFVFGNSGCCLTATHVLEMRVF